MAIIELFIGSHRRRRPGSRAVNPSVARSTTGAVTVPCGVVALPASIAVDRRLLVDVDAEPLDGVGQPARQLCGLNAGAVRVVVGRHHGVEPDPFGRFAFRQNGDAVDLPAELFLGFCGQPRRLRGVARDLQGAALDDARVDAFACRHVDDLVDGLVQRPLPGHHACRGRTAAPSCCGHRAPARTASRRCGRTRRSRRTGPPGRRCAATGRRA